MAKQTTMGKSSTPGKHTPGREAPQAPQQTKKQIAYGKRQARQQRIVTLILVGLGLVVLGIALAAVVSVAWLQPRKAVARVNGATIRMDEYVALTNVRRANLENAISNYENEISGLDTTDETNAFLIQYYQSYVDQLKTELTNVESSSLEELIEDSLIREKAGELGLSVSDAEVEESIAADLDSVFAGSASTVTSTETLTGTTPTPAPTATPVPQRTKDEYFASVLRSMGVSEKAFRGIISRSLLRTELEDLLASQVPTTGLVAHIKIIQTDTKEKADAAELQLQANVEFSVVATEVSSDTLTAGDGGDIAAVTPDQLVSDYGQEVSDLVFSLDTGARGQVESGGKFYIVLLVSREENGKLPDEVVSTKKSSALLDWLADREASPEVRIDRLIEPGPAATAP
ncbi:MAG TPA: SurA N-terminal domain-containing protein [Anaerolineae bacterium]|nr:SurA N-terminal domain-containing protein [Anaerolineae bacterium]